MSKNENQKERLYVGKGVKPSSENDLTNYVFNFDILAQNTWEYNGIRYVGVTGASLRQKDKYGKTHSAWINEYNSENKTEKAPAKPEKAVLEDDMPF